jgi:hypothetical protein
MGNHFAWGWPDLAGKTQIGRVTILVLAMNEPIFRAVRAELRNEGLRTLASHASVSAAHQGITFADVRAIPRMVSRRKKHSV